jgi:hypothetical protein
MRCLSLQAVDKAFVQDICAATRPVDFDQAVLNQASARHPVPSFDTAYASCHGGHHACTDTTS